MNEMDGWLRFVLLVGTIVISALAVVYGTLSHDIGELRGDVGRLRAEIRCLAEPDDCDVARLLSEMKAINDPLNTPICSEADLATFGGRGTWEDEELWNYEAGVKSTFLGGRGTFNASGFYMDIRNLQATVTAGTCSSRIIFNVPDARSAGVELELAAQPTTFFDFAVSASVADARLQSTITSTDEDGAVGVVSGIEAGRRLPTTPRFQAAAAATWRWPAGGGWVGYVSGTFQHVGSRFTQVGDQAAGFGSVDLTALSPALRPGAFIGGPLTQGSFTFDPELPAYNILNTRTGFLNGRWDIAFFVDNVTDERALLALDQERGTLARVGYLTNRPRSFASAHASISGHGPTRRPPPAAAVANQAPRPRGRARQSDDLFVRRCQPLQSPQHEPRRRGSSNSRPEAPSAREPALRAPGS